MTPEWVATLPGRPVAGDADIAPRTSGTWEAGVAYATLEPPASRPQEREMTADDVMATPEIHARLPHSFFVDLGATGSSAPTTGASWTARTRHGGPSGAVPAVTGSARPLPSRRLPTAHPDEDPDVPALRPLFAAAGVLLLIALVALAVRSGDDTAVPSAGGTVSPGETSTDALPSPTDEATTGLASPDASPEASPSPTETATDAPTPTEDATTGTDGTGTDGTGTDGTDTQGADGGSDGTDAGSSGSDGTDTQGTDPGSDGTGSDGTGSDGTDDDRDVVAIGDTGSDVDDMPDTGGGLATVLGGMVALGASAALVRRR